MVVFNVQDNPNSRRAEEPSPTPQQKHVKARKAERNPNKFGGDSKRDYERFDKMDQETISRMKKEVAEENEQI